MTESGTERLPAAIVLEDGILNRGLIAGREILYRGNNGRSVERFFMPAGESYIFKPLTNNAQLGREVWVYEQILPHFPVVFPKMIAYRISDNPQYSWLILEDLGPLSHEFREESLLAAVRSAALWHSLSLDGFPDIPVTGIKPGIEEMAVEVWASRKLFSQKQLRLIDDFEFTMKPVVSHGDLHQGNFALAGGRLIVLDWEHAHVNLPYWDLFHVIDMAHPVFSKKMTCKLREAALDCYLDQLDQPVDREVFKKEYYLFAAVFSLWMLLLIGRDLQADAGNWSKEQLERQRLETIGCLEQLCQRAC